VIVTPRTGRAPETARATALLVAALVAGALVAGVLVSATAVPAGAAVTTRVQDNTPQDNTPQVPVPHIIPRPNDGQPPKYSTDPGGTAQVAVFWGMCGAILLMIGLVVLESRRKLRRRRAAEETAPQRRSSTRSDPVADTSANAPDSSARQKIS
jgi:hypothetical protein